MSRLNQGKTRNFPFCPETKIGPQDKFSKHKKYIKLDDYTQNRKLFCDRTDKNKYLIHFKMTKVYINIGDGT